MSSERLQPLYVDASVLPRLPGKWNWAKFEDVAVAVPVGRKYDGKSIVTGGVVPVIDQSISGVMGHHSDEPGVNASGSCPVFTFANHTCAMRWMTHAFSCIQNVFAFRGNDRCDTQYLYYASQGRVVLEEYKGHAPTFRSMFVPVPPLSEQRDIAALLASLDNRIDLLRETNATLEAIAQALFKSWFVDFDPVRAKMAGRAPEGMDEATAALFPDALEETELGLVPKGWQLCGLGRLIDLTKGCSYKGEGLSESEGAFMFNLGCFNAHRVYASEKVKRYTGEYKPRHAVVAGDLIIANTDMTQARDILGRPAFVPEGLRPGFISHHVYKVNVLPEWADFAPAIRSFLFFGLQQASFRERAIGFATGTTVLALPAAAVLESVTPIPTKELLTVFGRTVKPLFDAIAANEQRATTLTELRDTLLPRLISGQLRLPEAQAQLEDALA